MVQLHSIVTGRQINLHYRIDQSINLVYTDDNPQVRQNSKDRENIKLYTHSNTIRKQEVFIK